MGRLGDSGGVDLLRFLPAVGRGMAWLPTLRQRLAAEQADVIHTNGFKAHVLVAMARPLRTPVVWHLHDFVSSRPLMRRLLPVLRNRAAVAISVSDAVGSDARAILQPLPVVTVLNGVRTTAFVGPTGPQTLMLSLSSSPLHRARCESALSQRSPPGKVIRSSSKQRVALETIPPDSILWVEGCI